MSRLIELNATLREEYFGGILYNAFGALRYLSKNEYYELKSAITTDDLSILSPNLIQTLVLDGFICPSNNRTMLRSINRSNSNYLSAPISLHFYPTYTCNQQCYFCYTPHHNLEDFERKQILEKAFLIIDECINFGIPIFNVLGGEPLLFFDELIAMFDKAHEHCYLGFSTNGSANSGITPEKAQALSKYKNLDVRISLTSPVSTQHNHFVNTSSAFETAITSIQNLVKYGVNCRISCVPTQINKKDIYLLINLAESLGADGFHLLPSIPSSDFNDSHELWLSDFEQFELSKRLKTDNNSGKWRKDFQVTSLNWFNNVLEYSNIKQFDGQSLCAIGQSIIEIDPNGNAYPCSMVLGNPNYCLGNILNDKLEQIWNSDALNIMRSKIVHNRLGTQCNSCENISICNGGCPLKSLYTNNFSTCPLVHT